MIVAGSLDGLMNREPWVEYAVCAQCDPEIFFPEKGGSTRQAKAICISCPVRAACLAYALERDEKFGLWGGLSERERRELKRRHRNDDPRPRCSNGHFLAEVGVHKSGRCAKCASDQNRAYQQRLKCGAR